MKKRMIPFAAATLAAGLAFAQTPTTPPTTSNRPASSHLRRAEMHERMMRELNLSASQKEKAKTIFDQARDQAKPLREQLRQDREAMEAAVKADDTAKIRTLAGKVGKTQGELTAIRSESMAKFYATLTPEQKAKADQLHQQMRQRMRERWEQQKTG